MKQNNPETIYRDPWEHLKEYTSARIALGRSGTSLPTKELLDFQLCHAMARDAVHTALNFEKVKGDMENITGGPVLLLESRAAGRHEYLRRPDLGRLLSERSIDELKKILPEKKYDISIVIADGLSATAIDQNAAPFMELLVPEFRRAGYSLAPVCLVKEGRVAVADAVGHILKADLVIILIGERPGLKSANSMGIYMTYHPEPGTPTREGTAYPTSGPKACLIMLPYQSCFT
jgi:ethanolamine ammonia-lyase small subunit